MNLHLHRHRVVFFYSYAYLIFMEANWRVNCPNMDQPNCLEAKHHRRHQSPHKSWSYEGAHVRLEAKKVLYSTRTLQNGWRRLLRQLLMAKIKLMCNNLECCTWISDPTQPQMQQKYAQPSLQWSWNLARTGRTQIYIDTQINAVPIACHIQKLGKWQGLAMHSQMVFGDNTMLRLHWFVEDMKHWVVNLQELRTYELSMHVLPQPIGHVHLLLSQYYHRHMVETSAITRGPGPGANIFG